MCYIFIFLAGPWITHAHSEHQEAQQRHKKDLQETLSGQSLLYGLELHFSSNPHPLVPVPELYCSSIPPCPSLCQSLTPSSCSELPQYYSPAWQSQGWVWSWSASLAHLLLELWDLVHRVEFVPWPIPLPPLAAQPFQNSLLLLLCCIFSQYFMQALQETKKKSHPSLHTPGYSLHYSKA